MRHDGGRSRNIEFQNKTYRLVLRRRFKADHWRLTIWHTNNFGDYVALIASAEWVEDQIRGWACGIRNEFTAKRFKDVIVDACKVGAKGWTVDWCEEPHILGQKEECF